MFAGLVERDELVQPVDDLLLHGQGEERVLAASSYLIVDDGLLVHNTATIMVRVEGEKGRYSAYFAKGNGTIRILSTVTQ